MPGRELVTSSEEKKTAILCWRGIKKKDRFDLPFEIGSVFSCPTTKTRTLPIQKKEDERMILSYCNG